MDTSADILHFSLHRQSRRLADERRSEAMQTTSVSSFFLYGEAPRAVDDRFLHVEDLDFRSRPSNWTIRPHAHVNLNHVFLLLAGGGAMRADARRAALHPPCLLVVPARVIHGFDFQPDTRGHVLTISDAFLQDLLQREPDLRPAFADAACLACTDFAPIEADLSRLATELAWQGLGHRLAVEARLLDVLVAVSRCRQAVHFEATPLASRQAHLLARYRAYVDERYRQAPSIDSAADHLNVSKSCLRAACAALARRSPLGILHDRIILEAKRLLLYTNMSIADVAFSIGFDDPAYFSRFFTKGSKLSPRAFRRAQGAAGEDARSREL